MYLWTPHCNDGNLALKTAFNGYMCIGHNVYSFLFLTLNPFAVLEIPDLDQCDDCHKCQHNPEVVAPIRLYLGRMEKVLPKNTGDERNWHKDGGYDGKLLHYL